MATARQSARLRRRMRKPKKVRISWTMMKTNPTPNYSWRVRIRATRRALTNTLSWSSIWAFWMWGRTVRGTSKWWTQCCSVTGAICLSRSFRPIRKRCSFMFTSTRRCWRRCLTIFTRPKWVKFTCACLTLTKVSSREKTQYRPLTELLSPSVKALHKRFAHAQFFPL